MKVVILCGGLGTRLREYTEHRPKPMIEVGGKPILWHVMKIYQSRGFHDFIVCVGYKGSIIKEYFQHYETNNSDFTYRPIDGSLQVHDGPSEKFSVTVADTGPLTQTGGRISRVKKYLDDDSFMVAYGDHVSDVDVSALFKYHKMHGKIATVTSAPHISRFGVLSIEDDGLVTSFQEKPKLEGYINIGFFVLNKEIFEYIDGDDCDFSKRPMQRLVQDGQLMAFRHEGFHCPMDVYRDHEVLTELWESGKAPWKTWED